MPPLRARPTRSSSAARTDTERAAWPDERPEAPLLALVEAAVEGRDLDARALAEAMGFTPATFRLALAAPRDLPRAQLDRLAALLGVDRTAVRAAAEAARPAVDAPVVLADAERH